FDVVNHLRTDMDASLLSAIFAASCPCQAQVRAVRNAANKHEHYIDHASINALRATVDSPTSADALVDYNSSVGGIVDSSGRTITRTPAKQHIRWIFHLSNSGSGWRITGIDNLQ